MRIAVGGDFHQFETPDVEKLCKSFAERHLPGRFVRLDTGDQTSRQGYLPKPLIADLQAVLKWPSADGLVACGMTSRAVPGLARPVKAVAMV